ncbi:MAG: LrgB family protein [Acidaminococcaceae bacterium]|jgi:predicted murein hydrolase (TIGR00659 family)|nr:LrgB family protein [Acidaminococcaceae bacterium]
MILPEVLVHSLLFGIALTIVAYVFSEYLVDRLSLNAVPPLVLATIFCIGVVFFVPGVTFQDYNAGAQFINFLLGPATIALALPLVKNWRTLKKYGPIIIGGVVLSTLVGIISIYVCGRVFGASEAVLVSMLPKSITTPIAMEVSASIGGIPALTVACVIFTGMLGAACNHRVLRLVGIKNDIAIGLAIGASSHGLGASACIGKSDLQLAIAVVSIALTGVATAILAPIMLPLLRSVG